MVQDENVKIARLDMVTVQRRPIPRPLPRVELRRHIVVAPDLDAVIIEKYPAFYPRPVFRGGDDLGRKGGILGSLESVAKPRPGFPAMCVTPK